MVASVSIKRDVVPGAGATLYELGAWQLGALATASHDLARELPSMTRVFGHLLGGSWVRRRIDGAAYACDVVDDGTPFELSLALGCGAQEVRMRVETAHDKPSLAGRWQAARSLGTVLRERHGANLARLDRVIDLFEPRSEHARFAMWYAVGFRPGRAPAWKVYLDLRARGRDNARAVLDEAVDRLGLAAELAAAHPGAMREAGGRDALDEPVYLAIDLAAHGAAHAELYVRHHHATAADLARAICEAGGASADEIRAFCTAVLGHAGPYRARPPVSCRALIAGRGPAGPALHAPIACYVRDDAEASGRVLRWLDRVGLDTMAYQRALAAFARRPLDAGVGMHSCVAFERDAGRPMLTVSLAPEAYRTFAPGELAARQMPVPRW